MKKLKSVIMLLFVFTTLVSTAQDNAKEIIRKMEDKMKGKSSYVEMSMTTVRQRYTREIKMKTWTKGEDYSLILITEPARDKGTSYLKRVKEMWNYQPNIDRMIKMPPSMMSQSWMGSDFTNDDLIRESSNVDDYTHKIIEEIKYEGYDCWVIEMIPKPESSIIYGKVKIWISKEQYLQLRVENYDDKGKLVNSILFKEVKMMGGRLLPTVMEMIPADKKNQKTIIKYIDAKFNQTIQDSFFSVQNLKNVR